MGRKLKRNVCLKALCLLLLIVTIASFNFKELRVTAASYTTNVVTSYTIFFDRTITNSFTSTAFLTTPLNINSTITITFPTQYTLTNSITCTYQLNSTGTFTPAACTQLNNQITLSNIFSGSTVLATATVVVANVLNPFPAGRTSNFVGTIGSDNAVANNVNSLVTITAATSVCGFTFSPNTVYSTASMIITLTVTNQFPSTGTIGVQFPLTKLWANQLDSSRALPIVTSMNCGSQSANVNPGIQCTGSASFATVTLSSVVTSSLTPGTTISFSISNFYSPPSNQPADSVVVTTYTGSSSIDACTAVVSGLIPKTIPSSQFSISQVDDLPMVVNQMYTLKFGLTTLDIISLSDYFVITFPAGTSINNFATATLGGTVGFNTFTSTYYNQVLTLYMQGSGVLATGLIYITISNFVAPPSILTTNNFEIQIMSNGFPKMVSYQTIQATTGLITGSIAMSVTTVNLITSYTFSIKISNPLTSAGRMKIIIPSIIEVNINSTCGVLTGSFMNTIPLCTYNSLENSIMFSNLNNSNNNIPAQTFTLLVNGLKNPPSNAITPAFSVTTYYTASESTAVDAGSISGVTATAGVIDYTTIVVSSSSFVTSDTGVTYYFSFLLNNPVPRGGFIIVHFPTIISFNLAVANNNCGISINASASATTPCTATLGTSYRFNFTNPFPSSGATINSNITLIILSAATNPPTTAPINPFSLQVFYSDGSSIANVYNSSSYTRIVTPSQFVSNQISKLSNKNGEFTSFTVSLIQIATLQANAIIRVTFPSSLLPQLTSACSITYQSSTTGVACGLTGSTFKIISLNSQIIGGTSFSITFTNVRNALSFSTISPFVTTTKSSSDLYFYSSSSSNNNIENTIPSAFKSLTYQYSPQELNTEVTLKLTFQFSQFSLVPGFLQISIDTYFGILGLSCSSFIDFSASCTSISSNSLKVSGSFNNSVMGFTVTGFTSPSFVPPSTTYTVINSFDSSGYKIDESATTISFAIGCNLPCKTCSTTNKSLCLSCYQTTNVTNSIYFHASSNNCYTTCPVTTYNNASLLLCYVCGTNCFHCLNSASFCTRCFVNSSFPYLQISNSTQICVSACQSGFFPNPSLDPTTCTVCKSPCLTCKDQNVCLSCLPGYFYLGNTTCTTTCTPDVTIANNATNVCDPCDLICLTCVGTITTCTACRSPLVFFNGSCQSSCPSGGKLAPANGICTACDSTCLTCFNTTNYCTSCNLTSLNIFLVDNKCLVRCPSFFYPQSSTGTCYSCELQNINCKNCSSANICIACDTGYVFFNNLCLTYTPTGYVNISGIAVICAGDCKTCEVTTANCTSCKTLNYEPFRCVSNCSAGRIPLLNVCVTCNTPCLTCIGQQSTCTSCIPTLNPLMYLFGTGCQEKCPDHYYANNSNLQCSPCINNCLICTSSVTCSSCQPNTFLYNTSCLSTCPSGFTGISGLCQACTNNCKTCSSGTNICLTCVQNTYFLNTSKACVTSCGTGLFIDYFSQNCIGCASVCKTCLNTSSSCTSCNGIDVLLNSQCLTQCPTSMFNQTGVCQNCPENCSTCTSLSSCLGCTGTNFLYNGDCIKTCPSTFGYVRNGACTKCTAQDCYQCTSSNVCISCNSGFVYLAARCLDTCPQPYTSNGTHCVDALASALEVVNKSFPVPFTIAGVVLIIACLMSRLQFHQTYLSGAIYSFIAILQWCAIWYFLYLYFSSSYMDEPIALYIGLGALGYLYIMNIVSAIAQSAFLCYSKQFSTWLSYSKFNKCFYYFTNTVSLIINHKFRNIVFCKLFTFKIFSAKLDKVQDFKIFNIFSLISIVHSGGAIFAAGVALTKTNNKQQLYHECLDVIILTGLNAVMAFFNTHKDKNFFEEITPEGYALHKKNSAIEEHLVGSKIHGLGEDAEIQEGFMNNYNHALTSKQALKFQSDSMGSVGLVGDGYSDGSMSELNEKMYEQASCQALDLINEKVNITAKTNAVAPKRTYQDISIQAESLIQQQRTKALNFSELPIKSFEADSSNFTNYNMFKKVDQSVQGYLDRGVNVSAQIQADNVDQSIQNDNHLGDYVDFSVQKNSNYEKNDISIQKTSRNPVDASMQYSSKQKDASLQYSRNMQDESVSMSRRQRSFGVQQKRTISNKSISANVSMRNQSNQLSVISQQDEQVQMQPDMAEQGIQPTIQFQDEAIQHQIEYEDYSVQPDIEYNQIAVQPTLDPSLNQIAIQYQPANEVNYNEFEEELGNSHTGSNILFQNEDVSGGEESSDRQLVQERVEELELKNQNIRTYQQQLQERIRNKEKELNEIKRKIEHKERMNEKKKIQLQEKKNRIDERDIQIQGYQYNEKRPFVKPPQRIENERVKSQKIEDDKQSLNREHLIQQIQFRREPQTKIDNKSNISNVQLGKEQSRRFAPYQLQIQSKQIPKGHKDSQRKGDEALQSKQSESIAYNDKTIEEIKVVKEDIVPKQQEKRSKVQQIRFEQVKPLKKNVEISETKSDFGRKHRVERRPVEYVRQDIDIQSEQQASQAKYQTHQNKTKNLMKQREKSIPVAQSNAIERSPKEIIRMKQQQATTRPQPPAYVQSNIYVRQQPISMQGSSQIPHHIEIKDMGNEQLEENSEANHQMIQYDPQQIQYEAKSNGNRQSEITRKNYYKQASNQRREVVVDVTEIDQSLKGVDDYIELQQASQSDQEPSGIHNAYYHAKPNIRDHSRSDLSGTIEQIPRHYENADNEKTISMNDHSNNRHQVSRPTVNQQKIANYFAGNLANAAQGRRNHDIPVQPEVKQHYRINKLYSNNDLKQKAEDIPKNIHQREKKNTFAIAGRAQLTDDKLMQKKVEAKYPLRTNKPEWEARQEDKYVSEDQQFQPNRTNLVRKPISTFASHLVLPQETDKQPTSFQGKGKIQQKPPTTAKERLTNTQSRRQAQQIQVHFEADRYSRQLSINQKNRSPQYPRAYNKRTTSNLESQLYDEDEEQVDYKNALVLNQMQSRPINGDLQDYYKRKNTSKDNRRKSNSKVDKSTEKIYLQRLDKNRK